MDYTCTDRMADDAGSIELIAADGSVETVDVTVRPDATYEVVFDAARRTFRRQRHEYDRLFGQSSLGAVRAAVLSNRIEGLVFGPDQAATEFSCSFVHSPRTRVAKHVPAEPLDPLMHPLAGAAEAIPAAGEKSASPHDSAGYLKLRHVGMYYTLTPALAKAVVGEVEQQDEVLDWITGMAQSISSTLELKLGVTTSEINIGEGKDADLGVHWTRQVPGGFVDQEVTSIFENVPHEVISFAVANHEFQKWSTDTGVVKASWWDMGMALGIGTPDGDPVGGKAALRGLCDPDNKGLSYYGVKPEYLGKPRYVINVLHEIGHQLGATHIFSSALCTDTPTLATAVEPGSGKTIMSYAGFCGADNAESERQRYFHGLSIDQIGQHFDALEKGTPDVPQAPAQCIGHEVVRNLVGHVSLSSQPLVVPSATPFFLQASFDGGEWLGTPTAKPGYINFEQINGLDQPPLAPAYASNNPFGGAHWESGIAIGGVVARRYFPSKYLGGQTTDPVPAAGPYRYDFIATLWDNIADGGTAYPSHAQDKATVYMSTLARPVVTVPAQQLKLGQTYDIGITPNFAANSSFSAIRAYLTTSNGAHVKQVFKDIIGVSGNLSLIPGIVLDNPDYVGKSYRIKVEYMQGPGGWWVFSQPFTVTQ